MLSSVVASWKVWNRDRSLQMWYADAENAVNAVNAVGDVSVSCCSCVVRVLADLALFES